ncbi:MAG: DnaJ domain-containing protein [Methyloprofundus sp.]|nr:DnaJ domain-containing protein [Methyloprofundus sp.]MBW6453066.1 J domain-containing protein [Methyloprofundus sp.]
MNTAYEILDVATTASDAEIKQAYLRLVKDNPPDRDQEKFQLIHHAYSAIRDHKSRVTYALFMLPEANFDTLIDQALHSDRLATFGAESINQLLRASVDDATLLNATATTEK